MLMIKIILILTVCIRRNVIIASKLPDIVNKQRQTQINPKPVLYIKFVN